MDALPVFRMRMVKAQAVKNHPPAELHVLSIQIVRAPEMAVPPVLKVKMEREPARFLRLVELFVPKLQTVLEPEMDA